MKSIIIYPENEKQNSLLKSLLEELKIRFEFKEKKDNTLLSEDDFYSKIDKSIKQAELGQIKVLPENKQKDFLGL